MKFRQSIDLLAVAAMVIVAVAFAFAFRAHHTTPRSTHHVSQFQKMAGACKSRRSFEIDGQTFVCQRITGR